MKYLNTLRSEAKQLRQLIAQICWYMRGSITWDQAWKLNLEERKIILKLIDDNVERTKKLKMPLI